MSAHLGLEIWICPIGEASSLEGIAPLLPTIQNTWFMHFKKNCKIFVKIVLSYKKRHLTGNLLGNFERIVHTSSLLVAALEEQIHFSQNANECYWNEYKWGQTYAFFVAAFKILIFFVEISFKKCMSSFSDAPMKEKFFYSEKIIVFLLFFFVCSTLTSNDVFLRMLLFCK